ncbi:MAG TPA: hypothetical protein VFF48_12205, partial [Brevundimonas sp.]|nr:hypothetical protein [Brevundimonas sp.]
HQFHGASPDGRHLAVGWESSGRPVERGAFLLDLETGDRRALQLNNSGSFSPDGRTLVVGSYSGSPGLLTEIVEYDLASGGRVTVASSPQWDWLPTYSRDGAFILFNSFRSGGSDMYRVDRGSGDLTRLTDDPAYEAHGQMFGDASSVFFHRQVAGADYDVMRLTVATGVTEPVARTSREESYPAMSPDGALLAFSSDRDAEVGHTDIYLMTPDGGGIRRLTSHPAKDAYASWSPDGRLLYYNSERDGRTAIYRMEIVNGDCRRL